jgi:hypothetical protein
MDDILPAGKVQHTSQLNTQQTRQWSDGVKTEDKKKMRQLGMAPSQNFCKNAHQLYRPVF